MLANALIYRPVTRGYAGGQSPS